MSKKYGESSEVTAFLLPLCGTHQVPQLIQISHHQSMSNDVMKPPPPPGQLLRSLFNLLFLIKRKSA